MAIILRDKNADFSNIRGAEKLYLDALTTEGTLILQDYSRQSCLPSGGLTKNAPVVDLSLGATDTNKDMEFIVNSEAFKDFDYNENGAYTLKNVGDDGGIVIGTDVLNYLHQNNPSKVLLILWIKTPYDESALDYGFTPFSSDRADGLGNGRLIRGVLTVHGHITITLNGVACQPISFKKTDSSFTQIAIVFERGQKNKSFRDSAKVNSDSTVTNDLNWGEPSGEGLYIGNRTNDGYNSNLQIGRFLLEDLDRSGRDEREVISMDYDYVNAKGAFTGIEKRPFANL